MARRFPRLPCNPVDAWSWLDAPDKFVRFLRTSHSRVMEEDELVSQGRHEWFLCAPSKTLKLGGNNRVQVLDVLRGRCLFDADGDATESAKKARTCLCICRVIVHDSGAFKIHDISPMEGYDVGFCPLLPALVRHRLDIAYTRYSDELTYERESAKPFSFEKPPPYLHNLAPFDIGKVNNHPIAGGDATTELVGTELGDEGPVVSDVVKERNKAITATSIRCTSQIPRVVAMAARAAVMACHEGKAVATVTELNPCLSRHDEIFVATEVDGRKGTMYTLEEDSTANSGEDSGEDEEK